MILLIAIIGFGNSIGLWIIGIDNPFLFGFLAAFLSIVPYVGTAIGAIIPILYAFVSFDSLWPVLAVAILLWLVQLITDNYQSPKIVGGSLRIHALSSILSLIIPTGQIFSTMSKQISTRQHRRYSFSCINHYLAANLRHINRNR